MSEPISLTVFDMSKKLIVSNGLGLCHAIHYIENYKDLMAQGKLVECWTPFGRVSPHSGWENPNDCKYSLDGFEGFYTDSFNVIIEIIRKLRDNNLLDQQINWESQWIEDIEKARDAGYSWRFFLEIN